MKSVNSVLTSFNEFYVKFKRTNQSCLPSKISQSVNVEWRTCDRNGKQLLQWQHEKQTLVVWESKECPNRKKKRYEQQKIYFYYISLNILVIQKCKRTAKLSMFRLDFWKKGVCSKFATKTLYWDRFWVRECIFKLLWELQVTRDWLCKRDIAETSLKRLLLLIIFKSSHRSCSVEKGVFKNFTGKH